MLLSRSPEKKVIAMSRDIRNFECSDKERCIFTKDLHDSIDSNSQMNQADDGGTSEASEGSP